MTAQPRNGDPILCLKDIHAGYGQREVLRGFSLDVHPGEIIGIIGGNGSGKSTLLKVAAGIVVPTSGRIQFRGEDITRLAVHQRQRCGIGYLMQNAPVFDSLTVGEQFAVSAPRDGNGQHAPRTFSGAIPSTKRGGALSGGERHLLALDLALRHKCHLLMLDEPTAGVAAEVVASIHKHLRQLVTGTEMAVLIVDHDHEAVARVSTRILDLSPVLAAAETTPNSGPQGAE